MSEHRIYALQTISPYEDGASFKSLIQKTGEAGDRSEFVIQRVIHREDAKLYCIVRDIILQSGQFVCVCMCQP